MQSVTYSTSIAIQRIDRLISEMVSFWSAADGWAPVEAAGLLSKSMLNWQSSLAAALSNWDRPLTEGELILAWANVGALVEGQLKLFLSAYYKDYVADAEAIRKKGAVIDPDVASLESLRVFFTKKIWSENDPWSEWVLMIQQRRNAIHAFQAKDIGSTADLHAAIPVLLQFIEDINKRLPYPDEQYIPRSH